MDVFDLLSKLQECDRELEVFIIDETDPDDIVSMETYEVIVKKEAVYIRAKS